MEVRKGIRLVLLLIVSPKGKVLTMIFAPVARYTTIRLIIALVASQGWNLHQMDVKTSFFNGSIKEEVYVEQLGGFEIYD